MHQLISSWHPSRIMNVNLGHRICGTRACNERALHLEQERRSEAREQKVHLAREPQISHASGRPTPHRCTADGTYAWHAYTQNSHHHAAPLCCRCCPLCALVTVPTCPWRRPYVPSAPPLHALGAAPTCPRRHPYVLPLPPLRATAAAIYGPSALAGKCHSITLVAWPPRRPPPPRCPTTMLPHHHATMTPSHQHVDVPLLPPCPIREQHSTYVPPSPYASPTLTPALPKCRLPVPLPTCLSAHVPTHSHMSRPQPTCPGP